MTDSMIERAARALWEQSGQPMKSRDASPSIRHPESEPDWERYVPAVRAVIAAMREPTEEMMKAKAVDDNGEQAEVDGYLDYLSADNIWRAMIDVALAENK